MQTVHDGSERHVSQMCELRFDERMFVRGVPRCKVSGLHPVSGIESDVFCGIVLEAKDV